MSCLPGETPFAGGGISEPVAIVTGHVLRPRRGIISRGPGTMDYDVGASERRDIRVHRKLVANFR